MKESRKWPCQTLGSGNETLPSVYAGYKSKGGRGEGRLS